MAESTSPTSQRDEQPDADAVVSNQPGFVLAVLVADCVPILIADAEGSAAAAIHAGWRGTCARVVSAAVEAMATAFGTRASHLVAAIRCVRFTSR